MSATHSMTVKIGALSGLFLVAALACLPANAEDTIECETAQTQQEMNICASEDFGTADVQLNAIYKEVKSKLTETDAYIDDADQKGAVAALLKAQRGWIDYRDGHCEAYGFQARGGSMEPMLVAGCKADLTRARATELQSLITDSNE